MLQNAIEKHTVTAVTRALVLNILWNLLKTLSTHGLDAETELANILSAEILAEINREVVRNIYVSAVAGAQVNTTTAGIFDLDTDSNGRWSVEKFKGLMFAIERDANAIGQQTRRGKGNMILCSADVASALQMPGILDYTPALNNNLNVDDTSTTFAGVMNGRFRVYVDPYAKRAPSQYYIVGYKELPHTMLVCSTAHTFHFRWFVRLVRTLSNQRLVSRPDMVCCKPIPHWYSCC